MNIVEPWFKIIDVNNMLKNMELGGRMCYKSEDKMCEGSDVAFVEKMKSFKHESVLEHGVITVQFGTDRGVTHELVRHRMASFSQESTRYCNYSKGKFKGEVAAIRPFFFDPLEETQEVALPGFVIQQTESERTVTLSDSLGPKANLNSFDIWLMSCLMAEWGYNTLTQQFKRHAQEARTVLPNSLKTEIQVTANAREWRHILALRTRAEAHPQIRQIMVPMAQALALRWPVLFQEFADTTHPAPATGFDLRE